MQDTTPEQEAITKNVLARMRRIEGQVRGIQRMIEEGKECEDVLIQVRAVRSALQSSAKLMLKRYLLRCHAECAENPDGQRESMEKAVKVVTNFIDG
ncbi:metal-sensitive transcriptional regulator [Pseudodesulfovibrio tunisiensis]|uniref:metal-sensitive transcriptional regulator n=1 Tax=Pseudodesulfovibrio tunisiensis TaxID=463192 RepID=UPI001FB36271|nr:metal-sensitive transcriptional regulator [Pseudodesulfovibrio tunisiensis]